MADGNKVQTDDNYTIYADYGTDNLYRLYTRLKANNLVDCSFKDFRELNGKKDDLNDGDELKLPSSLKMDKPGGVTVFQSEASKDTVFKYLKKNRN